MTVTVATTRLQSATQLIWAVGDLFYLIGSNGQSKFNDLTEDLGEFRWFLISSKMLLNENLYILIQ